MKGTERVKLVWGSEVEVHELPQHFKMKELRSALKDIYGHEHMRVYQKVPVGWKLGIRVISARHLPKADRGGLCDSYCKATIMDERFRYKGFSSIEEKSRSKIIKRSLAPDWNDNISLLVDGAAEPPQRENTAKKPVVRVEVLNDNSEDGKPDGMIGMVEFDLFEEVVASARYEQLLHMERHLEADMLSMAANGSDSEDELRKIIAHVKEKKKLARERQEAWHDLTWVAGCDPSFKVEDNGRFKVKGADANFACVKLALVPFMNVAQKSCYVNYVDDKLVRLINTVRADIGAPVDGYLTQLRKKGISDAYVLNQDGKTSLTDRVLEVSGILIPSHRAAMLEAVGPTRVPALTNPGELHLAAAASPHEFLEPTLPMQESSILAVSNDEELLRARKDYKEFVAAGVFKAFLTMQVKVTVYHAHNLPRMDKVGTCDPYVQVKVGDNTGFSRIFYNTLNADWGGQEVVVDMGSMFDSLSVSLWDFDELKVLDSKTRKVSVRRQDEMVGYIKDLSIKDLVQQGQIGRSSYTLVDERGKEVIGWSAAAAKKKKKSWVQNVEEEEEDPAAEKTTLTIAMSVWGHGEKGASNRRGSENGGFFGDSCLLTEHSSSATAQGKLFEIFSAYARGGRALAKKEGKELSSEAAAMTEGARAYLLDLMEFNIFLKAHKLLPDFFNKMEATEIFYEAKGGGKKAMLGDRQLDLHEFLEACKIMGDRLGKSIMQIAEGPESEAWAIEDDVKDHSGWRKDFPMHAAAADGNMGKFERVFEKLRVLEVKANSQAQGKARDIPYLVAKLVKRRRRTEFRVSVKSGKVEGRAPPWAQSSTNMGLANAQDTGGWTCLHHAVCKGHVELVLRLCVLGFEVNRVNKFWLRTPLHLAVERQDLEMVRLLLQCGADWNIPDAEGVTPISICPQEMLEGLSKTSLTLDRQCCLVERVTEDNEKRVCVETIRLDKMRAVTPARPGRCRTILLGSAPQRDLRFPWHKIESQNADSVFEIVTREFDSNSGCRPDADVKDETTNFGRDMPLTVADHNHFKAVTEGLGHIFCGPKSTVLTRKEMLEGIRTSLRVKAPTDIFYIVYSGSSQKYSGRWVCTDGFVDLNDVMKIWVASFAKAPANDGYPAKGTRLVFIIDSPASGMWVRQFESIRRGKAPKPTHGPFPYCFTFPNSTPSDPKGLRHASAKRMAPRGSPGRVAKSPTKTAASPNSEHEKEEAWPMEWIEVAKDMAIMASCGEFERAMEMSTGGSFMTRWATHDMQRKMRLEGIELCSAPLQVPGTACRQHPTTCVGWCIIPETMDPRIVHIAQGVYLTGSTFFDEDGVGGLKSKNMAIKSKASPAKFPSKQFAAYGPS